MAATVSAMHPPTEEEKLDALERRVEGGFEAIAERFDDQDKALLDIGEDTRGIKGELADLKRIVVARGNRVESRLGEIEKALRLLDEKLDRRLPGGE